MSIEQSLERIAVALERQNELSEKIATRLGGPLAPRVMDPVHDNGKVHVATAEKPPVKSTGLFDQQPEEPKKVAKVKKAPKEQAAAVDTVSTPAASGPKVTEDDVRAAMTKLVTAPGCGTAPAIRILKSYGVSKVSELSEADYSRIHAEFLAAIPKE